MDDPNLTTDQLADALEASRQRIARLEALAEISRTISSTLNFESILSEVARLCCKAVDATSVYVCTIDHEARTTVVIAEHFAPAATQAERVSDLGVVYYLASFPLLARWSDKPASPFAVHVDDPGLSAEEVNHLADYGSKSSLVIPLTAGKEFSGYIEVWESRHKRNFIAEEIELLQSVAGQVSVFIANARL
jgi:GAF domain-containing protein